MSSFLVYKWNGKFYRYFERPSFKLREFFHPFSQSSLKLNIYPRVQQKEELRNSEPAASASKSIWQRRCWVFSIKTASGQKRQRRVSCDLNKTSTSETWNTSQLETIFCVFAEDDFEKVFFYFKWLEHLKRRGGRRKR